MEQRGKSETMLQVQIHKKSNKLTSVLDGDNGSGVLHVLFRLSY